MLRKTKLRAPNRKSAEFTGPAGVNGPERLLAGYETRDIQCLETGWNYFARTLGTSEAKSAISELSSGVRQMNLPRSWTE